jgi:C4-dicarboxylate transporter DctM subunit
MLSLVIFGSFFSLALAGVPLMVALLATTAGIVTIYGMQYPLESVFLSFIGGVEPFISDRGPFICFHR